METDILDSLEDLGYKGPLLEDGALDVAVSAGAASPEFTKLCAWIVSELKLYCKLEENVHATNCPTEAEGFQLEMSGLLGELACPYSGLTTGSVTERLLNKNNCLLLLTFLISELEASRMILVNRPLKRAEEGGGNEVYKELKGICMSLGMSKPPSNITTFQFFSGIEKKVCKMRPPGIPCGFCFGRNGEMVEALKLVLPISVVYFFYSMINVALVLEDSSFKG